MAEFKINLSWNGGSDTIITNDNESDCYKAIAEKMVTLSIPNTLYVATNKGSAEYLLKQRGSFIKDGVTYPSLYIVEEFNNIKLDKCYTYPESYLTCINPESNNYKFYRLTPTPQGIDVTYGRIGAKAGEMFGEKKINEPYPTRLYWIRYYEKLSKGYIDQSKIFLAPKKVAKPISKKKEKQNSVSEKLYQQLKRYAKTVVEENLVSSNITEAQVKKARAIYNTMCQRKTVKGFNAQLLQLLQVSPRKARYVTELLAKNKSDFPQIIDREENLITAMETVAGTAYVTNLSSHFAKMGIEVYVANKEQHEKVLSKLSDNLKGKVVNVYRVINKKHKERFNNYLKDEGVKKVRELWHGSRNENWLSIMQTGLLLNPNAVITGKMFGDGLYFAPGSEKSWKYTSARGSYWAHGTDNTGFMGLYATAYGKPLDVQCAGKYNQRIVKSNGKNCVHAHAGTQLLNDEIIFYDERAVLLNYIVEFAA